VQRIIGIDPGSRITGYGIIDSIPGRVGFVSCGVIKTTLGYPLANRLNEIFNGINEVIQIYAPEVAAVEEVFMATNAGSALKLGQARGAAVVALMQNGLGVYDYSAKKVKRAVVGYGQAEKGQVQHMIRVLLGLSKEPSSDAADALAVAICHANHQLV
jgi:crossover junction endodeoxyribonuclease RuvC